jgi:IS5 family transposase
MLKIVLLQQWHTLSHPAAEEAVRDRLSFRRFCGLPLEMETPDHASIWRFRQTIDKLGLSAALLAETNRQLDALGLVVKRGTLVDATLIAASVRRPYEGGGVNPRDPDARFSRKRDKTYFGYKAHLAVDEGSGLVRQAEMISANVHDSRLGEALIQGDEQGYFADRAYDSQALRETLERRGLVDGIAWKVKHPRYPLEAWQRLFNLWSSSIRSSVERAHATMKRWYGMGRVRYLGLARNARDHPAGDLALPPIHLELSRCGRLVGGARSYGFVRERSALGESFWTHNCSGPAQTPRQAVQDLAPG